MGEIWTPLTDDERNYIYREHKRGKSDEEIGRELGKHRSTIYRARKHMPDSPLDEPFQWHKLTEYGIPWDASGYLLTLWHGIWKGELVDSVEDVQWITARDMLWAWRVHLAVPDMWHSFVLWWGRQLASVEMRHIVLGTEPDFDGYYQYLAFQELDGDEGARNYAKALAEGYVKPITLPSWLNLLDI
jgi:hypothetical protein